MKGRIPAGGPTLQAGAEALRRRVAEELQAVPVRLPRAKPPAVQGLAVSPVDLRPADPLAARVLLRGSFSLAGATLELGPGGDPWSTPSPSRRFAVQLHRFAWLPALLAKPEQGRAEGLRLVLGWAAAFGAPSGFAWSAEVLERRTFNLACAVGPLAEADPAEAGRLAEILARHARCLAELSGSLQREAERLAAAATAAAALAGRAGTQLLEALLLRLGRALDEAVLPDGGLRTRSPQQGLELLLDLRTLEEALHQRGREAPGALHLAIERLSGGARFFSLADGALAGFQGGEASAPAEIASALARDGGAHRPYSHLPQTGYHRLAGRSLQAIVDAGPPAREGFSEAACAHLLALEVTADGDRLFANTGWSPDALGPAALRLPAGANVAALGREAPGTILDGWRAQSLGPRLVDAPGRVAVQRNELDGGVWLEASHDGWVPKLGLRHERRLYLDGTADELRGEDRFHAVERRGGDRREPYAIRFHVPPEVKVSLALDGRSVLLEGRSKRRWGFRNDAAEVALEPSAHFRQGLPQRSVQVVLRGEAALGGETRVRWKLTPVERA